MRKFLTQKELELALEEVVNELENEVEQVDAVYIPPEVNQLTDEEEFSEDPENIENSQNGDIAGTFEIHTVRDEIYDESDEEDLATKRRKILERKAVSYNPTWRPGSFIHKNLPLFKEEEHIQELRGELEGLSPLDIFFKFVDENLMNLIIQFSEKYAQDNNRHEFYLSREELLNFLGILILSGYHSLPQTDMYWSLDEDKTVRIVRDCMNRNKFRSIKRNLHLSDNNNLDKGDKYIKLRPFFDTMNEKFLQFGIFSFNLSIDEQMVPYFGRHSCKMFIKGKPVRFGFKLWCICS
ncbi:piggyBac transposable element-derived protein 3-like [Anthonomus grandis grandis]|uniref:piggyBac transposable element-derived protein 3-like n=1 Tax=Anthonomus grandis grandis TaxID=2921223 RepID=UPI002165F901|nr:piggyBac transposable element-derived protein 3-like [Anthonomus grandis grandis]